MKTEAQEKPKEIPDNLFYIGGKPLSAYTMSAVMQMTKEETKDIKIIARGKHISKAVDVAEVVKKKFGDNNKNIKIEKIQTDSEEFEKDNKKFRVSTIEISLKK